jgi:putative transposase
MEKEVIKGYKFRIYPTQEQAEQIERTFGACRYVFNGMLAYKQFRYKEFGDKLSRFDLNKVLTQVKIAEDWLKDYDGEALGFAIRDMCRAYDSFFKGQGRYPRFKSKKNKKDSFTTRRKTITENTIKLGGKIGEVKILLHSGFKPQKIESEITVSKSAAGKYYASVLVKEKITLYPATDKRVGIDLGLKEFVTTSDEKYFQIPKRLWAEEERIVFLQKKLSRQTKGSKRYEKNRIQLAKHHERLANIRKDFQHKLSTKLIKENQFIALETLNVKGMLKNRKLSKAISRASFNQFEQLLESKAKWHNRTIGKIDQFFPSSKKCSCCGNVKEKLSLSERTYKCEKCGLVIDRDYNAAINILVEAVSKTVDL